MLCDPDGKCGSRQALDKYASAQSGDANPRPKGSSCPPTELTCVVPLPLTNAGRTSYQKPGWVKHAPVTRPKKAADNPRPVSCGAMSIHVGTCIDTAGAGSGIWNFIKHNKVGILIGGSIVVAAALLCIFGTDGAGAPLCGGLLGAAGDAAAEVPTAESLATAVADETGGALKVLKSGYSVTIPSGNREIVVRVMEEGGGRTNYYRVSIAGKEALTQGGKASSDKALTHIPIRGNSLNDILDILAKIGRLCHSH
jgi:hypothetical protein